MLSKFSWGLDRSLDRSSVRSETDSFADNFDWKEQIFFNRDKVGEADSEISSGDPSLESESENSIDAAIQSLENFGSSDLASDTEKV